MRLDKSFPALGKLVRSFTNVGDVGLGAHQLPGANQTKADWLDITEIPLTLPRMDAAFSGLRVAQISDIHLGGWMSGARLAHVVDAVLAREPDLVVLTGDFLCELVESKRREAQVQVLISQLGRISPAITTLVVMGNHDYWIDPQALQRVFDAVGMMKLSNAVFSLTRDNAELHFCGLDNFSENRTNLNMVLEKLPETGAAIALVHEPDFATFSAASERFDLQLSGHSHGGQVVLPGQKILAAPHLACDYPSGWYDVNGMQLYTNRGVGMSMFALRVNCRPEVAIFTLGTK